MAHTAFTQMAVNQTECSIHRDNCFGLDVLLYGGTWVGGGMEIPQLGITIELQQGDVIIMDSILFHQVQRKAGTRNSIVFFTKKYNETSSKGNILKVPKNMNWLYKNNFGLFGLFCYVLLLIIQRVLIIDVPANGDLALK
jgi:hypothetical protein